MAGYLPQMQFMDISPAIQANVLGLKIGQEESQRNLLRSIGQEAANNGLEAASKVALRGGDIKTGMQLSELSIDRQMKMYDFLGRAAVAADTPEKWSKYTAILSKQFGPESVKGFEDFSSRESAILLSKNAFDLAQQQAASQLFSAAITGAMGGAQPASGQPRGYRNNNPLNIEAGNFAASIPGYQGSDGRFAKFASLDQGVAAADKLLSTYGAQGINTVSGVINKWAPPTENNSTAYAATVAKALGVAPDAPINLADPGTRQKLIGAMAQVENGRPMTTPVVSGATIAGVPARQMLPSLIAAAANPNLPAGQKAVALEMLKSALDETKLPNDVKEYMFAVGQGETRTYTDWDVARKQAASTKVSQINRAENTYDAERAKTRVKKATDLIDAGDKAFATLGTIQIMRQAVNDPAFYSGVGAEKFVLPLKQAISSLGGDPKAAASMEVFRSQANKSVLDSMGGSLGTGFSNADRDFVVSQVPGLQNTREGNKALLDIIEKVERRKIEVSKLAQEYEQEKGRLDSGFDRILTQYRERNPLFSPQEKQQIQLLTASQSDLEAEAARRGLK